MRFPDRTINSIGELITSLTTDMEGINLPIWYRGQANSGWRLQPKLMRIQDPAPSESHYINKFKQNATIILNHKPHSEFDWLFLMQHYGVPTRLLDWSESPLVALYFALSDLSNVGCDGALWIMLPTELNKLSNYKPEYVSEIPSYEDDHLKNYLPSTIAAERKSSLLPLAAIAPRNSPRMQSQLGVFTINHRENIFIDEAGHDRTHVWCYLIPAESSITQRIKSAKFHKIPIVPRTRKLV